MTLEEWLAAAPDCVPIVVVTLLRMQLKEIVAPSTREAVLQAIGASHGLSVEQIRGRDKSKSVVKCRIACCQELRRMGLSYPEIGRELRRDQGTIMALVKGTKCKIGAGRMAAE